MGHRPLELSVFIQSSKQCYKIPIIKKLISAGGVFKQHKFWCYIKGVKLAMWNECPHFPTTLQRGGKASVIFTLGEGIFVTCKHIQREQSSPGYRQLGQVPSNWTRQIPHTSSSGTFHFHDATAFQDLIFTFMACGLGGCVLLYICMYVVLCSTCLLCARITVNSIHEKI